MNSQLTNGKRASEVREAVHQFLDLLAEGVARQLIEEQSRSDRPATRISSDTGLESNHKLTSRKGFENE